MRRAIAFFSTLAALSGCTDPCDPATISAALESARPGDVVDAAACRYEAAFTVPTGVTLRGRGAEQTIVTGTGMGSAIELADGAALEGLAIEISRGRGVSAGGTVALRGIAMRGPVDATSAEALGPLPAPAETATHGLVLTNAGHPDAPVELSDVDIRGFARFGALFVDSHVRWEDGAASENLGVGLMASGGSIVLADLEVCGTWRGLSPFGYGMVFRGGAAVETERVVLCDNEGTGALHDGADASHRALDASGNADAALWVQRTARFRLEGAALSENRLAGIVLVDTADVALVDSRIDRTREATRIVSDAELRVGDGVQAVLASAAGLRMQRLTLAGNERAGLVVQAADGVIPAEAAVDVVVEAEGDALGALAQTESALLDPEVWGSGLERRGAAVANDAALGDRISVLGAVAPMFLPPPEP